MAYIKNTWVDQDVARPKTYQVTENQDGSITLTDDFGLITELGTPVDQDHMNHIENGIEGVDVKVGELTNLQTTDKTSIVNAINSVLQVDTDRLHALKSYEDAGELLTDAEGLADVTKYAHSTFDESKFTKTGSPTITSAGVASGFSANNYIKYSSIQLGQADTWEIITPIYNFSSTSSAQFVFRCTYNEWYGGVQVLTESNKLKVKIGGTSSTDHDLLNLTSLSISANTNYQLKIAFTGSQYICYYKENTSDWTVYGSASTTTKLYNALNTFDIGKSSGYTTLDLKQFKITVDGVPVFSGNQTGTDTYTIGGSTVSVPYTLSKTGSKVVDSVYRTQVASVYSEFGFAPYYTLNEGVNFTLPQGELYGMLQSYCDGQWEYTDPANNTVSTANLTTNSPYDITSAVKSLLPDSNYAYECLFFYVINRTSDTTSSGYAIEVDGCEIMRDGIEGGGNSRSTGGQFIAVIKPDSTIKLIIENHHLSTEYTKLAMYRRLGKNN